MDRGIANTGTLVLVVGPSGAGKDTLIAGAKAELDGDSGFAFPKRCITRRADAGGEDFEPMDERAFAAAEVAGEFALRWRAHDLAYGLRGSAIDPPLAAGACVVANASRSVVDAARAAFPRVRVVLVTAPAAMLARRLAARRRESEADIAARLARAGAFDVDGCDLVIVNDAGMEEGIQAFLDGLRGFAAGGR